MKITYWSDYACPYCYIGETRVKKAMNKLGLENIVSFEMKAFQLDPYAPVQSVGPTQKRFAQKYGISYGQAGQRIKQISALGRQEGLSFNYLSTLFTNTMDAHRLTKLVQETGSKEQVEELKSALFQAYFADNKELADHEVLLAAAVQVGFDQETVETFLEGERFKQQVLLIKRRRDNWESREYLILSLMIVMLLPGHNRSKVSKQLYVKLISNSFQNPNLMTSYHADQKVAVFSA